MNIPRTPSCDDSREGVLLPVEQALQRLQALLEPLVEQQYLTVANLRGRVLSEDIRSPVDVPPQANSAMDGYALHRSSIPRSGTRGLRVVGSAWAGRPFEGTVGSSEAVRVFTGAVLPRGADTVVIQEHVLVEGDLVFIDERVQAGRNVRAAGEDVRRGDIVLGKGAQVGAAEMGVLASLGINRVAVSRRLKVAIFTTGDELRSLETHAGAALPSGTLFDSNRYTLSAMLDSPALELIDFGVIADNPDATRQVLRDAADAADVVISSGGVSAGDADYVSTALHDVGEVSFWKIAMRPGRPLAVGRIGGAVFFGLPGNPVAVMVTFLQFVQPALRRLMGMHYTPPFSIPARLTSNLRKTPGRTEFQRGVLSEDTDGTPIVSSTGMQGAGRLSSMMRANCLIVLPAELAAVGPGDMVRVQPFYGLMP